MPYESIRFMSNHTIIGAFAGKIRASTTKELPTVPRRSDSIRRFANAYNSRGACWLGKGEYDIAILDFDEARRRNPKLFDPYNNLGQCWSRKGEYDKAIANYNQAIRVAPANPLGYNNRAWVMATCPAAKHRDGAKAIKDATKACELTDWKNPLYLDTLAAAYAERSQFDKAVEHQEKAVEHQEKAIELTPEAERNTYRTRLGLYKSGKPYRQ